MAQHKPVLFTNGSERQHFERHHCCLHIHSLQRARKRESHILVARWQHGTPLAVVSSEMRVGQRAAIYSEHTHDDQQAVGDSSFVYHRFEFGKTKKVFA